MLRQVFVTDPDRLNPWYADGLRFQCLRCGNCCAGAPGHVWVTPDELVRIATHLGLSNADFDRNHLRRVGRRRSLLERPGGDCEFLLRSPADQTGCAIHPVRPVQCQTWPFWKCNLASPKAWELAATSCPGINRGQHHPLPIVQAALDSNGRLPL